MSYWYIEGDDGKNYCWAKHPTFSCPIGSAERLGDLLEVACIEGGYDPEWLLRRIKHNAYRKRIDGRQTDICETCGHKLDRLGFKCWIYSPKAESSAAVHLVMGTTEREFYVDTKAKAERWARSEVKQSKEAVNAGRDS